MPSPQRQRRHMRRSTRSLRHVLRSLVAEEGAHTLTDGYVALAGAVLRQAVFDARLRAPRATREAERVRLHDQEQAQAFLEKPENGLAFWCDLVGADVEVIQELLLRTMTG